MSARTSRAAVAAMTQAAVASAAEQLRVRALRQAELWNTNTDDLRETTQLNEWRDNCRDEIFDELLGEYATSDRDALLAEWSKAFDGATLKHKLLINGFEPVGAADIDDTVTIAHEQVEAMGALFRSVAHRCGDRDVQLLCQHGALQADLVANDIDSLRERAMVAGLLTGGVA